MPEVDDSMCFACGEKNPISLRLDFKRTSDFTVEAEFIPGEYHQGYDDIMHGGLVATLLDEAMAYAVGVRGIKAFTAELNIRFRKAAEIGEKLIIKGYYKDCNKRSIGTIHYTEAEIFDKDGKLKAKAEAKFMEQK